MKPTECICDDDATDIMCPQHGVDPVVEAVDDECPTCGAYVLNHALHQDWHTGLLMSVREALEQARRYKPPPVYGGQR